MDALTNRSKLIWITPLISLQNVDSRRGKRMVVSETAPRPCPKAPRKMDRESFSDASDVKIAAIAARRPVCSGCRSDNDYNGWLFLVCIATTSRTKRMGVSRTRVWATYLTQDGMADDVLLQRPFVERQEQNRDWQSWHGNKIFGFFRLCRDATSHGATTLVGGYVWDITSSFWMSTSDIYRFVWHDI